MPVFVLSAVTRTVRGKGTRLFMAGSGVYFRHAKIKLTSGQGGHNGTEKALKQIQLLKRPVRQWSQRQYFRDAKIIGLIAETLNRSSVWLSRQLDVLPERAGQMMIFAARKYSRHRQSSPCHLSLILLPSAPIRVPCRSTGQLRQGQPTSDRNAQIFATRK